MCIYVCIYIYIYIYTYVVLGAQGFKADYEESSILESILWPPNCGNAMFPLMLHLHTDE